MAPVFVSFGWLAEEGIHVGVVAVFIDGGYLDKLLLQDAKGSRIDYQKVAAEMATPDELLRAYYY